MTEEPPKIPGSVYDSNHRQCLFIKPICDDKRLNAPKAVTLVRYVRARMALPRHFSQPANSIFKTIVNRIGVLDARFGNEMPYFQQVDPSLR